MTQRLNPQQKTDFHCLSRYMVVIFVGNTTYINQNVTYIDQDVTNIDQDVTYIDQKLHTSIRMLHILIRVMGTGCYLYLC